MFKYITLRNIVIWGCLFIVLSALAEATKNDLIFWTSIIGTSILVLVTIFGIIRWWHKTTIIRAIKLTYLVPSANYNNKQFPNAPEQESKPRKLTLGVGKYQLFIMHSHKVISTATYPPIVEMIGANVNKPQSLLLNKHPFVVGKRIDAQGIKRDVDWHGNTIATNPTNTQYLPGTVGLIAHPIETYGYWDGKICVTFRIKERDKPIVKSLRLVVTEVKEQDQISFLKQG